MEWGLGCCSSSVPYTSRPWIAYNLNLRVLKTCISPFRPHSFQTRKTLQRQFVVLSTGQKLTWILLWICITNMEINFGGNLNSIDCKECVFDDAVGLDYEVWSKMNAGILTLMFLVFVKLHVRLNCRTTTKVKVMRQTIIRTVAAVL